MLIEKIAKHLNVPVSAFYQPPRSVQTPEAHEQELLVLFRAINDPRHRADALAFVRAMAESARQN